MELLHPRLGGEDERDLGLAHRVAAPVGAHERDRPGLERRRDPRCDIRLDRERDARVVRALQRAASVIRECEDRRIGRHVVASARVVLHREHVDAIARHQRAARRHE